MDFCEYDCRFPKINVSLIYGGEVALLELSSVQRGRVGQYTEKLVIHEFYAGYRLHSNN